MQTLATPDHRFLSEYLGTFQEVLRGDPELIPRLLAARDAIVTASTAGKKTVIIGNGGSAAMSSHVAVDLTKNARVRATDFSDASFITCLSNDFGFEKWIAKAIEFHGDEGDVLIAISSSGKSPNILNACKSARDRKFSAVITFSGFGSDNPLRTLGDINFWAPSRSYNHVEMAHHVWLVALVDLIIGKAEYPA
jgi:phosphoheptose isomerase